jgi:hypothetical protein
MIDGQVPPSRAHAAITAHFESVELPSPTRILHSTPSFSIVPSKHLRILRIFTAMTSLLPTFTRHITPRVGAVALPNSAKAFPGRQSNA